VTAPADAAFVAAVHAALAEQVRSIADEAGRDVWRHLQHRHLAERIKALVAAWHGATGTEEPAEDAGLLRNAVSLAERLRELQGPSGLFAGGDNVDSPPDSAFSINDLADALLLLRQGAASPSSASPNETPAGTTHQPAAAPRSAPPSATPVDHPHQPGTTPCHASPSNTHAEQAQQSDFAPRSASLSETPAGHPHQPAAARGSAIPSEMSNTPTDVVGVQAEDPARRLAELLEKLLADATPALTRGGVHTPNHRWELSAALARLHRLRPQAELAARVGEWLAEGIDSANYAAHVSNPSLLTIADVFDRPELADVVERNLDATLDLLLPDGSVETVLSRRQDQRHRMMLADHLLPLRRVARRRGRGDLAWAAGLALAQGIVSPAEAATRIALDPGIALELPAATPPDRPRQRVFGAAGLLMDHRVTTTAVVFGGSDYARHRRIRSGLANSPTFLRLFAGAAVLDSVRLTRTFFGLGPFRGDRLAVTPDGTSVTLTETVAASYFQPLAPGDRDAGGSYRLADEGRFSAAMDFDRRRRDEVTLTTTIRVDRIEAGVRLTADVSEAAPPPVLGPPNDIENPGRTGTAPLTASRLTNDASNPGASETAPPPTPRNDAENPSRTGTAPLPSLGPADGTENTGPIGTAPLTTPGPTDGTENPSPAGTMPPPSDTNGMENPSPTGIGVPWALELAFRAGGSMTGARAISGRRWQLDAAAVGVAEARYRVGTESLKVTIVEAHDGRGGALREAAGEPAYHPGEEYEFLGGTDAAGGELLYVAAHAPARLLIDIRAYDAPDISAAGT
jgi:hypothetical protein